MIDQYKQDISNILEQGKSDFERKQNLTNYLREAGKTPELSVKLAFVAVVYFRPGRLANIAFNDNEIKLITNLITQLKSKKMDEVQKISTKLEKFIMKDAKGGGRSITLENFWNRYGITIGTPAAVSAGAGADAPAPNNQAEDPDLQAALEASLRDQYGADAPAADINENLQRAIEESLKIHQQDLPAHTPHDPDKVKRKIKRETARLLGQAETGIQVIRNLLAGADAPARPAAPAAVPAGADAPARPAAPAAVPAGAGAPAPNNQAEDPELLEMLAASLRTAEEDGCRRAEARLQEEEILQQGLIMSNSPQSNTIFPSSKTRSGSTSSTSSSELTQDGSWRGSQPGAADPAAATPAPTLTDAAMNAIIRGEGVSIGLGGIGFGGQRSANAAVFNVGQGAARSALEGGVVPTSSRQQPDISGDEELARRLQNSHRKEGEPYIG
jgi:hypothetical protein